MNKSLVLSVLKFISSRLKEDPEVIQATQLLTQKIDQIDFQKSSKKEIDKMPVPSELQNVAEGIIIFTDGACRGNPGPGSWAMIAHNFQGEILVKASGLDLLTTNNKMELMAVIEALKWASSAYKSDDMVYLFADSKYVLDGLEKWVPSWKSRDWKKADNKKPENLELWQELDQLKGSFSNLKLFWVKGHAGIIQNEICDDLCNEALNEAGY